jgi:ABC-type microcin C transport system duplicated ATPase subunit YejF
VSFGKKKNATHKTNGAELPFGEAPLIFSAVQFGVAKASAPRPDLFGIDLKLRQGEILSVLGREGSGRAILRDRLLGVPHLKEAFIGSFAFGEKGRPPPRIAYLPGPLNEAISPYSTMLRQLVRILARRENFPEDAAREELRLAFERLPFAPEISEIDKRPADLLPRDRAAGFLALALAGRTDAIVADDPASNLDPVEAEEYIETLLAETKRNNWGLIYFTGNPATAVRLGGRIAVLRDGKLVEEGDAGHIASEDADLFTQTFFRAVPQPKSDGVARTTLRSEPLLQVRGFALDKTTTPYEPSKALNFELRRGGSIAVVGMRKSGRRAFVRAVLGLDKIEQGKVILDSVDIGVLSSTMRARLRQKVAFLPGDDATLDPRMTVAEFVGEPIRAQVHSGRRERMRAVEDALARVGMGEVPSNRLCTDLDTLNRRRVQIARVLTAVPQLLVLLEPLKGLDAIGQAILLDLIKWLRERRGIALLLVTADFRAAKALADQAFVIRARRLVEKGSIDELLQNPQSEYTRELADAANAGAVSSP